MPATNSPTLIAARAALHRCGQEQLQRVRPEPKAAIHFLNVNIEPACLSNRGSQGGNAAETTTAEINVIGLPARAPSYRRGYVGGMVVGTGVDDLDNDVSGRVAAVVIGSTTVSERATRIALHGDANAAIPTRLALARA
jgi:hypothetical protein